MGFHVDTRIEREREIRLDGGRFYFSTSTFAPPFRYSRGFLVSFVHGFNRLSSLRLERNDRDDFYFKRFEIFKEIVG